MTKTRTHNLERLKSTFVKDSESAKVIVMEGYSRVEADLLLKQIADEVGREYYSLSGYPPKEQQSLSSDLIDFSKQISQQFTVDRPVFNDWDEALFALPKLILKGNCVLTLNEISWICKTEEDITTILFTVWELYMKHIRGLILILTSSQRNWIQEHITNSTGWYGRISLVIS